VREVNVPIVADIHFHYRRAIEAAEAGAACLRINPATSAAPSACARCQGRRDHGCSMRIGVNAGSLEKHLLEKYGEPCPEALVESALGTPTHPAGQRFHEFKISVKASDVFLAVAAYQQLAEACDHPLHIGITEAGGKRAGTVKSRSASASCCGPGSATRCASRCRPSRRRRCGRLGDAEVAASAPSRREDHLLPVLRAAGLRRDPHGREAGGAARAHQTPMTLSIIGCVVNGPGEALMTDIGLTGGGNGTHMVYIAGVAAPRLKDADIVEHLVELVEKEGRRDRGRGREEARPKAGRRVGKRSPSSSEFKATFPVSKLQPVRGTHDLMPSRRLSARTTSSTRPARDVATASTAIARWRRRSSSSPRSSRARSATRPTSSPRRCTPSPDRGGESAHAAARRTPPASAARWSRTGSRSNLPRKVFYAGPMFRYERPQKGRYRQFHQIDAEVLGAPEPLADAEVIACGWDILRPGRRDGVVLEINTLGDARAATPTAPRWSTISRATATLSRGQPVRLEKQPAAHPRQQGRGRPAIVADAPSIDDYLTPARRDFFAARAEGPRRYRHPYRENPAHRARPRLLQPHGLRVRHDRSSARRAP
jgi:(E)-4-hydroxy-3-methylbut-2-enyl-diphosphate synthase